jgi:hypothetical protein
LKCDVAYYRGKEGDWRELHSSTLSKKLFTSAVKIVLLGGKI